MLKTDEIQQQLFTKIPAKYNKKTRKSWIIGALRVITKGLSVPRSLTKARSLDLLPTYLLSSQFVQVAIFKMFVQSPMTLYDLWTN